MLFFTLARACTRTHECTHLHANTFDIHGPQVGFQVLLKGCFVNYCHWSKLRSKSTDSSLLHFFAEKITIGDEAPQLAIILHMHTHTHTYMSMFIVLKIFYQCQGVLLNQCQGVLLNQCPGVLLNQCPGVLLNQCPGVILNQCPGVILNQCPCVLLNQCPGVLLN